MYYKYIHAIIEKGVKTMTLLQQMRTFSNLLKSNAPKTLKLRIADENLTASLGIKEQLQYADRSSQLLGKSVEYYVDLPVGKLPLSLQLYENINDHWRLFLFTQHSGLILSVNFSIAQKQGDAFILEQTMKVSTQSLNSDERNANRDALLGCLYSEGFSIAKNNHLILGTYDGKKAEFIDTPVVRFIKDFLRAGLIKGHFMANKGYSIPSLASREKINYSILMSDIRKTGERQIPLLLRYQVLERDRGCCVLCGRSVVDGVKLHVDHIVPFSKGGMTVLENLQTLCDDDNLGKGNRSTKSFLRARR